MSHTCKYTEKNSEFEGKTQFEARVSEFLRKLTIELQMLYARNLGFLHISSKNPVDADIANRKHYSAPAGAVTYVFHVHILLSWERVTNPPNLALDVFVFVSVTAEFWKSKT